MSQHMPIKNLELERRLFKRRVLMAGLIAFIGILVLLSRLFMLQVLQYKSYATLSKQNRLQIIPIAPNRGLIYDRNGVLLADNIPVFSLDITRDQVKDLKDTLSRLGHIISISNTDLKYFKKALRQHRPSTPVPLKLQLNKQEVAKFYVHQYAFPGVSVDARLLRHYPVGEVMTPVLGYVGRINDCELEHIDSANYAASNFIGKDGIEKQYEKELHGTVGYKQVEVDAGGHAIRTIKRVAPIAGANLYLTIDSKLQEIATKALGGECGAVVAIEPKTGQVLVLASNPSFDPNLLVHGMSSADFNKLLMSPDKPMFNRALQGEFPIASTIKPFLALEGLDSGVITKDYTIYDPGWFRLPNTHHIYRDWNWRHGGHGEVNVTKAIIVSSDTFFYNLGVLLGINRIDDILNRFGFGMSTGIDLPSEQIGLIPSPAWKWKYKGERWFKGDTVNSGIGQGFMLTTTLQLANAVATLANRGLRFKPHVLLKSSANETSIKAPKTEAEDPVMIQNKWAWQTVITAMEGVIRSVRPFGTARIRFGTNPKYSVAAKTGTGQVYSRRGNRDEEARSEANIPKRLRTDSLFIAFAPVKHPKIALAVIVEHSPIAGTVARRVLDAYLLHSNKVSVKPRRSPLSRR
ncbi:MAG: penicillin-binding protein 2 [Gammaproteobacteria bacterium]|nr:penicillin-binding protein 2 [Gammaproteobacteria bacterium]